MLNLDLVIFSLFEYLGILQGQLISQWIDLLEGTAYFCSIVPNWMVFISHRLELFLLEDHSFILSHEKYVLNSYPVIGSGLSKRDAKKEIKHLCPEGSPVTHGQLFWEG